MGVPFIPEFLGRVPQIQRVGLALFHVGSLHAHQADQALLQRSGLLETPPRGMLHPGMHERRERSIVAGDAQPLQVVERPPHPLGSEAGGRHQLVGGDALVRVGLDQRLADGQQLLPVGVNNCSQFSGF